MSSCVKTGFAFVVQSDRPPRQIRIGDLFHEFSTWSIRGTNPHLVPHLYPLEPHAVVACQLVQRPPREHALRFLDADRVELLEVSERFREHLREWYPWLLGEVAALPGVGEWRGKS